MANELKQLIHLCDQELSNREYGFTRHRRISESWGGLLQWATEKGCLDFDADIGYQYCDEVFGSSILSGIG